MAWLEDKIFNAHTAHTSCTILGASAHRKKKKRRRRVQGYMVPVWSCKHKREETMSVAIATDGSYARFSMKLHQRKHHQKASSKNLMTAIEKHQNALPCPLPSLSSSARLPILWHVGTSGQVRNISKLCLVALLRNMWHLGGIQAFRSTCPRLFPLGFFQCQEYWYQATWHQHLSFMKQRQNLGKSDSIHEGMCMHPTNNAIIWQAAWKRDED